MRGFAGRLPEADRWSKARHDGKAQSRSLNACSGFIFRKHLPVASVHPPEGERGGKAGATMASVRRAEKTP